MTYKMALSSPDIEEGDIALVNHVLRTPYLSIGPMLETFEAEFARYTGTRHAVAVSSGTAGLHLGMIAAGIGPGDEVITTAFSFVASSNVILYQGARPIFADIDPETLNIDPNQVEDKILARRREGKRVKAILPVHVFGQPCEMDALMDIAERYDVALVEDACEAVGADYKGQRVGTFGRSAVFAFYPNKQMTTGEGGMIVTDHDEWAYLFRSLRNQGRDGDGNWLRHVRLGYNYRMDEMSAALGLSQLRRIDALIDKRARVARMYNRSLAGLAGVRVPFIAPQTTRMSWFVYVIRLAPQIDRDQVMRELSDNGIPARPYFAPIHLQPFYREQFGFREGDLPVTERIAHSTLALPFHGNLDQADADFLVETLSQLLSEKVQAC